MVNLWHTRSNPIEIMFDMWALTFIKMYYWPFFVAGTADNVVDLFKPQTYSICK